MKNYRVILNKEGEVDRLVYPDAYAPRCNVTVQTYSIRERTEYGSSYLDLEDHLPVHLVTGALYEPPEYNIKYHVEYIGVFSGRQKTLEFDSLEEARFVAQHLEFRSWKTKQRVQVRKVETLRFTNREIV